MKHRQQHSVLRRFTLTFAYLVALGATASGCTETPSDAALRTGVAGSASGAGSAGMAAAVGAGGGGAGGAPLVSAGAGGAAGGVGGAGGLGGTAGAPQAMLLDWHYFGRWNLGDPMQATTVNSGSHVLATFDGAGVSASFDLSGNTGVLPTVAWRIDQGEWVEAEIAAALSLASNLPPGEHSVKVFVRGMSENDERWTPPLVSSTVFKGFVVSGGDLVPSPRPRLPKIEFLGDSITEGVLVHGQGPAGQSTPNWRTDGPKAYAALTAMSLDADFRQVGFGRQGLTIQGNGGVPKAADAFNWVYAGVPRDEWQPDIVVINQGTNDRGTDGAVFASLYGAFLGVVRAAYPQATIVALRPLVGAFALEIEAEVEARKAAGDSKVMYVTTEGWTTGADYTDGLHPNATGSGVIRDRLLPILQALL